MTKFKKICLSGSMSVVSKMNEMRHVLESKQVEVEMPSMTESNSDASMPSEFGAQRRNEVMKTHLGRIKESEALLVVNENIKGVEGYIGANTFLEMGFAFALGKPIFLLNSVPEQTNKEEILGLYPIVLQGNLEAM